MPRSSLKVLRKPESRCNNSSPRICVRTTMLSLALFIEFLRFSNYKISITLLILPKCLESAIANSIAKLIKFFQIQAIASLKSAK